MQYASARYKHITYERLDVLSITALRAFLDVITIFRLGKVISYVMQVMFCVFCLYPAFSSMDGGATKLAASETCWCEPDCPSSPEKPLRIDGLCLDALPERQNSKSLVILFCSLFSSTLNALQKAMSNISLKLTPELIIVPTTLQR